MKRQLYCDVCATTTEHVIDDSEDEGDELALCVRCGRLHSVPRDASPAQSKPRPASPCPTPCRDQ